MEGTRHERVALVIVAYIIGFVTAFIAFGVNSMHEEQASIRDTNSTKLAYAAQQKVVKASPIISKIEIGEDGLFIESNGYKRILSADRNTLPANVISGFGDQGYFYKIIDALVSNDGQFAYYCEQQDLKDNSCSAFIYSLRDDTLYPVKIDGKRYDSALESHKARWEDMSTLMLDGAVSSSSSKPWFLSASNTASSSAENSN